MTIGERVKELRLDKGYTLRQVADTVGVSEATMQRYENGKIKISTPMINKLASALGTSASWLLGEQERDLTQNGQVFGISKTERILIQIYRILSQQERTMVRELLFALNYHHTDYNRTRHELEKAEDFIDAYDLYDEYTEYKNTWIDETPVADYDDTDPIHASIVDAMMDVNPEAAAKYAKPLNEAGMPESELPPVEDFPEIDPEAIERLLNEDKEGDDK